MAVVVETHPQSANVSIADSFTLSCAASAYPLPNISWWHNSTLVDKANPLITVNQTSEPRVVTSVITIVNATTSNGGTYVCVVGTPPGTNFSTTSSNAAVILVQGERVSHVPFLFGFCCVHGDETCQFLMMTC